MLLKSGRLSELWETQLCQDVSLHGLQSGMVVETCEELKRHPDKLTEEVLGSYRSLQELQAM